MTDGKAETSLRCPQCGSDDVRPEKWARRSVIGVFLLTGLPVPLRSRVHHCFDCQGKFKLVNGQAVVIVERTSWFIVAVLIIVVGLGGWLVYQWTWL